LYLLPQKHREDAAVDAHVADLRLVGDAAQRDNGPVLDLERRNLAEFFFGPRQVADDEPAARASQVFILAEFAHIAQPLGHHTAGGGRDVDADPLAIEVLRRNERRPATAESI